jgi:anti-sigma factor RsiW
METELTCQELLTFVAEYAAGRLSPAARAEFEAHLAHCERCVAYLNDFPAILRLAQSCAVGPGGLSAEVPRELVAAVLASRARA